MRMLQLATLVFIIALSSDAFAQSQARRLTSRIVNPDNTLKTAPQLGLQPTPPSPTSTAPAAAPVAVPVVTNVVPEKTKEQKAEMVRKTVEFQKKRAEAGAPTAQYDLALRYLTGNGVEKDPKLGRKWLETAATNGSNQAVKKLSELDKK
ncbi:MAG: SEL1-like repeat protein [Verrucomicrobiota bacterium]